VRARFCVLGLVCACCLTAQSKNPADLALGKVLVTPRDAKDPAFAKSVILLVRYGDSGVVGLMLNRRSTLPISRVLHDVPGSQAHSDPVFVGGPVELDTVLALVRARTVPDGATNVFGNIQLVASRAALEKALSGPAAESAFRIYLGYCGWTQPQLENEVRLGAWYIFNRNEGLAFDPSPATLWDTLIGKAEEQIVRSDELEKPRHETLSIFHRPPAGVSILPANH
jgi:putative transcriptional regulator